MTLALNFRLMGASGDPHFETSTEHARCDFDLVKPGCVAQVEQAIHPSKADGRTVRCPRLALLAAGSSLRASM